MINIVLIFLNTYFECVFFDKSVFSHVQFIKLPLQVLLRFLMPLLISQV